MYREKERERERERERENSYYVYSICDVFDKTFAKHMELWVALGTTQGFWATCLRPQGYPNPTQDREVTQARA